MTPTTTTLYNAQACFGSAFGMLSADVSPDPSGGTVQFSINGVNVGIPQTIYEGGYALLFYNPSELTLGDHPIGAEFSGFGDFLSSNDDATLTVVDDVPEVFNVSGGGGYPSGGDGVTITLSGSETGVYYYLNRIGDPDYSVEMDGTGDPLDFTGITIPDTYYIWAYAVCNAEMNGTVDVFIITTGPTDYFRSKTTGNWSNTSTWESSADNSTWVDAVAAPTNASAGITISTGHTVTVNADVTASDLTIAIDGILDFSGTGKLSINGDFTPVGQFTCGTGTMEFNSSGSQTIPALNYYNLTSSNWGQRILDPTGTIGIAGVFTPVNGSYTYVNSTLSFNGTATQDIPYMFDIYNLVIDNPAGVNVIYTSVRHNLNFVRGVINTPGTGEFSMPPNATITGTGPSCYINGKLTWYFPGPATHEFPVGKGGHFRPVTLSVNSLLEDNIISVEQFEGPMPGTPPAGTTLFADRYWVISCNEEYPAFNGNYTVTLDGTDFTPSGDVVMVKGDDVSLASYATTGTHPYYTNAEGFTSFSYFGLGELDVTIPTTTSMINAEICNGSSNGLIFAVVTPDPMGGTVQFTLDGVDKGTPQIVRRGAEGYEGSGIAYLTFDASTLSPGDHPIGAVFSGYETYLASSSDPDNNGTLTIYALPDVPTGVTSDSPACPNPGAMISSPDYPGGEISWYIENAAAGTSTALPLGSYVTSSGTYYVRAYNETTGCWSNGAASTVVSIKATTLATDHFRTAGTTNAHRYWKDLTTWESSSDGTSWCPATLAPTSAAADITLREFAYITVDLDATASNLVLATNSLFNIDMDKKLSLTGDLTGNGSMLTGNGIIELNGVSMQSVRGMDLKDLIINNAAGITMTGDVNLGNNLEFLNGLITTGSNAIKVSGAISGADASKYINGRLSMDLNEPGSKLFPIGKDGAYRPLTIEMTDIEAGGYNTLTAEQFETSIPGGAPSGVSLFSSRYWTVTREGDLGFAYKITLDGTGFSPTHPVKMLKGTGTNTAFAVTTSTDYYTNAADFTSFSNFGLGEESTIPTTTTADNKAICEGASFVLLTSTVTPNPGTGTVQFKIDGSDVGGPANLTSGTAMYTYDTHLLSAGDHTIEAYFPGNSSYMASNGSGTLTVNSHPANPDNPTSDSPKCANDVITLTRQGTVPAGETWYWENSASETSTANSGETFNVYFSGTYYLRSQNNATGCWSPTGGSVAVVFNPAPSGPGIPTSNSPQCADIGVTITRAADPPAGITYYWQTVYNGVSTANSGSTYTVYTTGTYYLHAQNDATGCWSSTSSSILVTVNALPREPIRATRHRTRRNAQMQVLPSHVQAHLRAT